jgi:LacI family transcriptional regulator
VSYQTVSRVINDHPYVADDTRQRVLKAIEELDYRPNRAAQSLAGHRSRTLGMITFGLSNYGPAQMMINIEHAAREAGYDLIFVNASDAQLGSMRTAVDHVRRWEVDGLLLITPVQGITYAELQALCGNSPIVQIGTLPGADAPSVIVDQELGTRSLVEHLIRLGHRRFAEIRGPWHWHDAQARHESLKATLAGAGLAVGPSTDGDWSPQNGYDAACALVRRRGSGAADFTALVVANDQMAIGAIRALQEHGLRVPDDVSVVGFDDIPEAAFTNPPLTTVRQEFDQMGQQGVEYLIEIIADPGMPRGQRVIPPHLVLRESSAPPPR